MSKILSVVIPAYNCEKTLEKAVDSVLAQPCADDIEIILVDDGAKDGTPQLCDELAAKHSNITTIHRENGGEGPARNTGIAAAMGKYLAVLDSDDWWEPNVFDEELKNKLVNENIDIYTFPIKYISPDFKHQKVKKPPVKAEDAIGFGKQIYPHFMHQTVFYLMKLIKENNITYPTLKALSDQPFVMNAISIAQSYCAVDKVLYNYYINLNSFYHDINDADIFYAGIQVAYCTNEWGEKNGNDVRITDRGILSNIVKYLPRYCATHSFEETVKYFEDPIFRVMRDPSIKPWNEYQEAYDLWNSDKKKFWRKAKLKNYIPCKFVETRTKPPFVKLKNYVWYRFIKKMY